MQAHLNSRSVAATAYALRTLYFTRAAFSVAWVCLLLLFGQCAPIATALLLLYPAWDVAATFLDLRANQGAASRLPQYSNIAIGVLTTVAVGIALGRGIPAVLLVFGVWAGLTGFIQLLLGLRRRRQLGGQWPMILSGGQSIVAGVAFMLMAHSPTAGVQNLAGYSAVGALYFLVAAFRLGKSVPAA